MSDEATETAAPVPTPTDAPAVEPGTHARGARATRTTGGQTYVDRYLTPFVVPVVAVAAIIFYVLNLSRALLSGKGTIAVVVAAIVTVAILFGAAALSSAPKMRSHTLAITLGVSLLALLFTGWITVGHSQEEKAATAVACPNPVATVKVAAEASLKFTVDVSQVKTGCVAFDYGGAAGHTLAFHPPGPGDPVLHSDSSGPQKFAWNLTPGSYVFYCTVSGHEAAGMKATLTVK